MLVTQLSPTLCDPMDCSPPGYSIHGILQARILAAAAAAATKSLQSCLTLCDPRDGTHQAPLSMGASGKNTAVGCHFLLQGIVLTQGSNPRLPHCRQILNHLSHQGSP